MYKICFYATDKQIITLDSNNDFGDYFTQIRSLAKSGITLIGGQIRDNVFYYSARRATDKELRDLAYGRFKIDQISFSLANPKRMQLITKSCE